jgi:hypothetical protein
MVPLGSFSPLLIEDAPWMAGFYARPRRKRSSMDEDHVANRNGRAEKMRVPIRFNPIEKRYKKPRK